MVRILDTDCYTLEEMSKKFCQNKQAFIHHYYKIKGLKYFKMGNRVYFPAIAYEEFRFKLTGVRNTKKEDDE